MATVQVRWRVDIIESERGWGQRVDDRKYFDEECDAIMFVADFNKDNNLPSAPDWYMYACDPVMEIVK